MVFYKFSLLQMMCLKPSGRNSLCFVPEGIRFGSYTNPSIEIISLYDPT